MATFIHKFNSLHTFADFCNNTPVSKLFSTRYDLASETSSESFSGTADFATANQLLKNGDMATAAKVKKEYTNIIARTKVQRPRPTPAIVGHTPIVGAYLAGDPVCMLAKKNRQTRARVITIIYNSVVNYDTEANDMAKAGANLLAAINTIEANGVRVNLWAAEVAKCSGRRDESIVTIVRIKTDCQPLNLAQIAYPIANPSFLRRHYFRITEVTKDLKDKKWLRGYGHAVHGESAKRLLEGTNIKYDCYLDFNDTFGTAPATLVKKIVANVK